MARAVLLLALLGLAALLGANSVTRLRRFTPDSMVYVDVARNFDRGRGLGYRTLPLNEPAIPVGRSLPVPLTTFPPLYPLAIAALARAVPGLEAAEAALALAALGWLAIVLLGGALARRAWGDAAGLLAVAVLLVHAPLHDAGTTAWSEPLGVALVLGALLALPAPGTPAPARAALSGLLGGLAFATRYALAPVLALGPLALLAGQASARRTWPAVVAWLGAALVPVALVLGRNQHFDGTLMPAAGPATIAWSANAGATLRQLLGDVLSERAWAAQATTVALLLGVALAAEWRRERTLRGLVPEAAWPLAGWVAAYALFLVVESSLREFDPIGARLVLPAGAAAAVVGAGLVARGLRVPVRAAALVLVVAMAFVGVREARIARRLPAVTTAQQVAASPRLAWLAAHTGPRDLLIGDDAGDLAFWLRRDALSFSHWPGAVPPTPGRLRAWCLPHREEYGAMWIVLSDRWPHARDWGARFGPFFARLATGRDTVDAGVRPAAVLADALVYRYDPAAAPGQ